MTARHVANRGYSGLERRSSMDRRYGRERRNLIRFESFGSDRREGLYRRYEDLQWEKSFQVR